jgi:hypothetical protein
VARRPDQHATADDPSVPTLLWALREAGANEAVSTLAARAANAGLWKLILMADNGKARQYKFGRQPNGAASAPWGWRDLTD